MPEPATPPDEVVVRVWDLPVRLFHWALVILVIASYVTAQLDALDWHMRSGEAILALLVFRILWGVVGSDTARFAGFLRGPHAVLRHLKGADDAAGDGYLGHNAAGGWAVVAMLLLLGAQVGTGLFADDDISETGPLGGLVSHATRKFITGLHHANVNFLLALIGLHVAAIAFYRFARRQDLLWPMISGRKSLPPGTAAPRLRGLWLAVPLFAASLGFAAWIASFGQAD